MIFLLAGLSKENYQMCFRYTRQENFVNCRRAKKVGVLSVHQVILKVLEIYLRT